MKSTLVIAGLAVSLASATKCERYTLVSSDEAGLCDCGTKGTAQSYVVGAPKLDALSTEACAKACHEGYNCESFSFDETLHLCKLYSGAASEVIAKEDDSSCLTFYDRECYQCATGTDKTTATAAGYAAPTETDCDETETAKAPYQTGHNNSGYGHPGMPDAYGHPNKSTTDCDETETTKAPYQTGHNGGYEQPAKPTTTDCDETETTKAPYQTGQNGGYEQPAESTTDCEETAVPTITKDSYGHDLTTTTFYATKTHTVTKCPDYVTDCPARITTEVYPVSTTVCPVGQKFTTSTVYATQVHTVTKCPDYVTDCPVGQVTAKTYAVSTTICPVEEPTAPAYTAPAGGYTAPVGGNYSAPYPSYVPGKGGESSGNQPSQSGSYQAPPAASAPAYGGESSGNGAYQPPSNSSSYPAASTPAAAVPTGTSYVIGAAARVSGGLELIVAAAGILAFLL